MWILLWAATITFGAHISTTSGTATFQTEAACNAGRLVMLENPAWMPFNSYVQAVCIPAA